MARGQLRQWSEFKLITLTLTSMIMFPTSATVDHNEEATPKWNPYTLPPEALVDIALERLSAAGVQLIEWRALLYRRLNVPIIAKVRKNPPPLRQSLIAT